jgi:hypothetical protein
MSTIAAGLSSSFEVTNNLAVRLLQTCSTNTKSTVGLSQAKILGSAGVMRTSASPRVQAAAAVNAEDDGRQMPLDQPQGADMKQPTIARRAIMGVFASAFLSAVVAVPTAARADEGGVSFWVPGFFGSLAAAPQQPG